MSRAPSILPFPLQPNPSPQQLYHQNIEANQHHMSSICRTGPYPITRHECTNKFCLIFFILLCIATITLFSINYFAYNSIQQKQMRFQRLNFLQKIIFGIKVSLVQTMLACVGMIIVGAIFVLIVILLPFFSGYFIIAICIALLGFILYSLIVLKSTDAYQVSAKYTLQNEAEVEIFRIGLIVIVCLGILLILFLLVTRIKKLKHLGAMMKVVKVVLTNNMPILPSIMLFVLNGIAIGLWYALTKMTWNSIRMLFHPVSLPIPPIIVFLLVLWLWIWEHGIIKSLGYYICQSYVIHWYYNANSQYNPGITALKDNWRFNVFHKTLRYHLGTIIYGFILTYIADFFLKILKACTKPISRSKVVQSYVNLTYYCYIITVMQCLGFCKANYQMSFLRRRIKQKLPTIYMLGRFLQNILVLTLVLSTLYFWFFLSYKFNRFIQNNHVLDYSLFMYILMCLLICYGIFQEVASNISHIFGVVSDTAVISYCIDFQVESVHYEQNMAKSLPLQLVVPFRDLNIDLKLLELEQPGIRQTLKKQLAGLVGLPNMAGGVPPPGQLAGPPISPMTNTGPGIAGPNMGMSGGAPMFDSRIPAYPSMNPPVSPPALSPEAQIASTISQMMSPMLTSNPTPMRPM